MAAPDTRDLSIAMDELRAAHQAWQENDKEFNILKDVGKASEVEVNEFSAFVDDLKDRVLEGCREVRTLGGNPDTLGVACRPLEQESRKATDATEDRDTRDAAKRQADAGSGAREAATTSADEKTAAAKAGDKTSTAQGRGEPPERTGPASEAKTRETQQASRGDKRQNLDSSRQRGTDAEGRQASQSPANSGGVEQARASSPPRQRSGTASNTPAGVSGRSLPQSESQAYQSQLRALEAELDGYLNSQLSKVRERTADRRQTQSQASAGYARGEGAGAAGADGVWGSSGGLSGAGMQPQEPGAGPGVQKEGTPPRWSPPPGVGDGSDDDVVARQLREAAQAETDPETRRRLWEEYKKYKDST